MRCRSIALVALCIALPAVAGQSEDELAATLGQMLGKRFVADWQGVEALKAVDWAPLPPRMLRDCLPDGGCFARQGTARIGDRTLGVLASGARDFVSHLHLRNPGPPFGETAVLAALRQAGLTSTLARCPVAATPGPGTGGTNWYRVSGAGLGPGYLSIQTSCNGQPCEGFVVSLGDRLPPLQPDQQRLYSQQCAAARPARARAGRRRCRPWRGVAGRLNRSA